MTCSMVDYIIAAKKRSSPSSRWMASVWAKGLSLKQGEDDRLSKTEMDFDFSSVESTEIPLNNVAAKMQSLVIFAPQKFLSKCHQVIVILFRALSTTGYWESATPFYSFSPNDTKCSLWSNNPGGDTIHHFWMSRCSWFRTLLLEHPGWLAHPVLYIFTRRWLPIASKGSLYNK